MSKSILLFLYALCLCSRLAAQPFNFDPAFGENGYALVNSDLDGAMNEIASLPDGSVLCAGLARATNNAFDYFLCKFSSNGIRDTTFGNAGYLTTPVSADADRAHAFALQADGKIVVAGFAFINGNWDFSVVRYHPDGSFDQDFGANGIVTTDLHEGLDDFAYDIKIQPDGKIVVAGYTYTGSNTTEGDLALVRYLPNGALDESFGEDGIFISSYPGNDRASAMLILPDGKILCSGWEASPNTGYATFMLTQYTTDGVADSGFGQNGRVTTNVGAYFNLAYDLLLQPDGKIVVAGNSFTGITNNMVAVRYHPDGSLDLSFGFFGIVIFSEFETSEAFAIAQQPDGKLLLAGSVGAYPFQDFAVLRLMPNGAPDFSFGVNGFLALVRGGLAGNSDELYCIALQADGAILAAGLSVKIDQNRTLLVAVRIAQATTDISQPGTSTGIAASCVPNPFSDQLAVVFELENEAAVSLFVTDLAGKQWYTLLSNVPKDAGKHHLSLPGTDALPPGFYLVHLTANGTKTVLKVVKQS